jgi:dienelactone hydrolase
MVSASAAPRPAAPVGRRPLLASMLLAGLAAPASVRPEPAAAQAAQAAQAAVTPVLPALTGRYPVGALPLHLVDPSRPDPWDAALGARELMVTVFHPARDGSGTPLPYMTPAAAASFGFLAPLLHPGLPAAGVDWAGTVTHARVGAPPRPGRRPVLLYSPGGGDPRTLGTSLAADLASHGFVVVAVDHPGDASEVELPGGRLRSTVFRGDPRADLATWRTMTGARVADLRFVAGALPAALPADLARTLDPRRIGVYGHSAGGTAAASLLAADRRVAAAVNLEGYLDDPAGAPLPVAERGARRPLALVTTGAFPDMAAAWSVTIRRSAGRATRHAVPDAAHWVFADYAALAPDLQARGLMPAAAREALVGTIPPAVSIPLVRAGVRRFFTAHLR